VTKVLLVVPIHNRPEELKELLSSLISLNIEGLELSITIVDDASLVPVPCNIGDEFPQLNLNVIRRDVNIGPASARNVALKNSSADFFWFLDSDSEIDDPQVLKNMVESFRSHPLVGAVGGVVELVNGEWLVFVPISFLNTLRVPQYLPRKNYPISFVGVIPTANLLVSRKIFELTNSFDEKLPRNEDEDLCLAFKKLGYKSMQSEKTLVKHKLSRSGRDSGAFSHFQNTKDYFSDLLKTRSLLLYKYSFWKLLILPILDMLTLFELMIRSKNNNFKLARFSLVKKEGKLNFYWNLALLTAYYYFYGLLLSLKIR
jgi:GT2 family glycosyltransferase